ncbi:unnamed protein product [Paramecium octaurelia]|uniref:Activator of Hsp90 ATPase AHSA1-like N-terminal domain-containing protein n=1 Tax=Paramecium octaurelia TaxID=43137 RepID=A0A8S1X184_PAROT|nr:unnamed protein product [Paramecium octaurelia]
MDNPKKEHSYTYWVKHDPNHPKIDCQPKKVEDPSQVQQPQTIGSQWNVSGTWEEKKVPMSDIKKSLENIIGMKIGQTKISAVESVEGEAHLYLSRGKKRMGYHLKITYALEDDGQIKYTDFTDDGDRDYVLEDVNDETVKHQIEELHDQTKQFVEVFKN